MKSEVLVVELDEQLSIFHHLLSCGATILGEHHHLVLTVVGLQNLSNGEGSMRCAVLNNCLHSCQGCRHLLGVHGVVLVVIEEDHVALPDRPDMSHAHEIRLALVVHHHGAGILVDLEDDCWASPALASSIFTIYFNFCCSRHIVSKL